MKKIGIKTIATLLTLSLLIVGTFPITTLSGQTILTGSTVRPGENISVSTTGFAETNNSWVGFYKVGASDTVYTSYAYIRNLTDGIYTVKAPKDLGNYEFRFFKDSAYIKTGTSTTISVIQYTPTFLLNKSSVVPNEEIILNYQGAPVFENAWVGFYKVGADDKIYTNFKYTKGDAQGTFSVKAPMTTGEYEFRMFLDSAYTKIGESSRVIVEEFKPKLTLSTYEVKPGATVTVNFSNASTNPNAWVGLYELTAQDKVYTSLQYTKGLVEGQLEFIMPSKEGIYEFRAFKDSAYDKLATSLNIKVTESATVPIPPADLVEGAGVRLTWQIETSALGYRVFRSTDGSLGISLTDFYITGTSFADVNVLPNTTYYYTVKPVLKEAEPIAGMSEVLGTTMMTYIIKTKDTTFLPEARKGFIILKLADPYMVVNGNEEEIDPGRGTVPVIISSRTMVPIRAIVEAMGGNIAWEQATQKITLNAKGNKVEMWIGKTEMLVNGVPKTMDVAPVIQNSRTYVPVRFAAENLNSKVDWINSTREAVITFEN
jgi:hypothetical protein